MIVRYFSFFIFVLITITSCGLLVEKDMKAKLEEINKIRAAFSTDIEKNIDYAQKVYEEAIELCDKDTTLCEELGLKTSIRNLYDEIEVFKAQKNGFEKISKFYDAIETCPENEYDDILIEIEKYVKQYPKGYKIENIYEFRDEFLRKEFYRLNKANLVTSMIESSFAYDLHITALNDYLIKVRNEDYRREFSEKIQEIKLERDRLKEREIQEEANEQQVRLQEEAQSQERQRVQNAQSYQARYNSAINNLFSSMASKAKSVAGKGHSVNCDVIIKSDEVVSQTKTGNRIDVTKTYHIQIGGDSWVSMCKKSSETVIVSGDVEGDGSRSVDYNVTGGRKN